MKKRSVTPAEAVARIAADGARVMIGGFMGVGSPHRLIGTSRRALCVERRACVP